MPKGFNPVTPRPWVFRVHDGCGPVVSFALGAIDGEPLTVKTASTTAVLVVSLLQQPDDAMCIARMERVLPSHDVEALRDIAPELDPVFWVDVIDPRGKRRGQGHSQASGRLPTTRQEGPIRRINPDSVLPSRVDIPHCIG
jgi:hypothetical protein